MLICAALALLIAVCGCLNTSNSNSLSDDKYVVITENYLESGYPLPNPYIINFEVPVPTPPEPFDFTGSMGYFGVTQGRDVKVNDAFKILVGDNVQRSDPRTISYSLNVSGIYRFPYTLPSGFIVLGVDNNGTILGMYNNTPVSLKVYDEWRSPPSTWVVKKNLYSWDGPNLTNLTERPLDVQYCSTWTVINTGIYNKTDLVS